MQLSLLGWNSRLSNAFTSLVADDTAQGLAPARVISAQRDLCTVAGEDGELLADVAGRFRLTAAGKSDYPAVGDWAVIAARPAEGRATIHALLPRTNAIERMDALAAGDPGRRAEEQVVAANVDTALIVMGLDHDFNPRRLERYLTAAWGSGVQPVVVLNKADLCAELPERLAETEAVAVGVPVLTVSAADGTGLEALSPFLAPATTAVLIGSSGVGKSTLINRLLGEDRMATGAVREDDQRGRHTTTHRELVVLPGGALLVDNPGMRALGLWGDEADLGGAFSDIEELAQACRFADCRHGAEPGCAVRGALADGTLAEERWASWRKLQKELAFLAQRDDVRAQLAQKQVMRTRAKTMKGFKKHRSR